jgi:hypothetical protein
VTGHRQARTTRAAVGAVNDGRHGIDDIHRGAR